jgi:hypothetical protein
MIKTTFTTAVLLLIATAALAEPLPVPKPFGSGRLVSAWLAVIGLVLCALAARAGRGCQAAGRHVPVGMDGERLVLPAQRERALMAKDPRDFTERRDRAGDAQAGRLARSPDRACGDGAATVALHAHVGNPTSMSAAAAAIAAIVAAIVAVGACR